jgi:type I restriction enzyme M protein
MTQTIDLDALGKRLWKAADDLRANSGQASNQYFFPVMGLIFLRHAHSRYLRVRQEIEATLPVRGGKTRELTKDDFAKRTSLYLQPQAQFEYLVGLTEAEDIGKAINDAMQSIETDYPELAQTLPRGYDLLEKDLLARLLRTFNDKDLESASGDVFGRIYEYFLVSFANQSAHDGGEFFTPVSLVQMIVNVLEPEKGRIFDPACGSGGMFVQSSHFLETHGKDSSALVFNGQEKNPDTIKLAKMNLAVHGLSGNINQAISYYGYGEQPLKVGEADFVMANPPFNVDEIDAEKIKNDPRLSFGLPGTNKEGKVPNGNYIWISYFYAYLNATGRAGFVMSSQTSSAGRDEAKVRESLVKTGHVDAIIAIRGGFFYTRTVPCELWFLDKGKPASRQDQVLMIDARNVNRKVTRVIYDFSPEHLQNLSSIVWLYREQPERFLNLVGQHLTHSLRETETLEDLLVNFSLMQTALLQSVKTYLAPTKIKLDQPASLFAVGTVKAAPESLPELEVAHGAFVKDAATLKDTLETNRETLQNHFSTTSNESLHAAAGLLQPSMNRLQELGKQADHLFKLSQRLLVHDHSDHY